MSDTSNGEPEVDGVEQALRSLREKLPPFRPPSPLQHPQLRPLPPAVRTLGPRSVPRPQYHLVSTCSSRNNNNSSDQPSDDNSAKQSEEVYAEFAGIEELGRTAVESAELADRTRLTVCYLQEEAHLEVRALPDDEDVDREKIIRLEEREFMCAARHIQSKISLLRVAQQQRFVQVSHELDLQSTQGAEELARAEHRAWVDLLYWFRTHRPELSASDGLNSAGAGSSRFHESPSRVRATSRSGVTSDDITPQKVIANNHVYWEVQGQYDWELQKQNVWNWWKQSSTRAELVAAEDQGRLDIVAEEIRHFMVLDEVSLEQVFRIRRAEKEFTGKLAHVPAPPAAGRHLAEAIIEAERLVTEVLNSDVRPSSAKASGEAAAQQPPQNPATSSEGAEATQGNNNISPLLRQPAPPNVTLTPEAEEAVKHSDHKALELVLQIGQAVRASNEAYSKGVPLLTGLLPLEAATRVMISTEAAEAQQQREEEEKKQQQQQDEKALVEQQEATKAAEEPVAAASAPPPQPVEEVAPAAIVEHRIPLFCEFDEEKVLIDLDPSTRSEPRTRYSNLNTLIDTVLDGPQSATRVATWFPLISTMEQDVVAVKGHEELELALVLNTATFGKQFLKILWNTRRHHPDIGNAIELVPCRWTQYKTVGDLEAEELMEMTFAEMLQREDVVNEQVAEVYAMWLQRKHIIEALWSQREQEGN